MLVRSRWRAETTATYQTALAGRGLVKPICRIGRKTAKLLTVIKRPVDQDYDTARVSGPSHMLSMFRFLFRMLGLLFLGAAFVFVVYDGTRSIADGALLYTKSTEAWTLFHAASLQRLQLFIQGNATRWLWETVVVTILDAPVALVLGVVGATLVFLGAPKIAAR
jgi:hypothetical protein